MLRTRGILVAITTLVAGVSVAMGQTPLAQAPLAQAPVASPDSALQTILDKLEGTPLLLNQAIQYGLANATSVRIAEAGFTSARGALRREAGTFDPALFFSLNHLDQQSPTASFFSGAPVLSTQQTTANGGVRMSLPFGTSIEASLNTMRLQTNSSFASLNPQYTTFGSITLRQPLLGGFTASARKNLTKAEQDLEGAKARYDYEVIAISTQVEQRYWDLFAGERDYAVQKLTRDRAEAFLKDTQVRAKAGLIGPDQVANAQTFLAEQEVLLLDREEGLALLSDQLSFLIGQKPEMGKPSFTTIDHPPDEFPLDDVDAIVEQAKQRNLTLQAAKADVESRRALARGAFWEALPKVNVIGSLGGNGLAGTGQDISFNGVTYPGPPSATLGDAVRQALRRDYPTWSVGIEVSVPIGLRSGLGEEERLEADVTAAEQRLVQFERDLELQVRGSCRELFHGQRRLKAAREGVQAAQEQVRIGLIQFQNGRSTAFELVRLGADFAAAQQRYSQALVRSVKAAAALKELTSGAYAGAMQR
jgi:outer membrane protein